MRCVQNAKYGSKMQNSITDKDVLGQLNLGKYESKGLLALFQNSDFFYDPWLVSIRNVRNDFDSVEVSLQGSQDKIIAHLLFVGVPAIDRKGEEVLATLLHMADLNPGPLVQLGQLAALQVEHAILIVIIHIQVNVQL